MQIETKIVQVSPESLKNKILRDGKATRCNSGLSTCGQFQYSTHKVTRGPNGEIVPDNVRIGLCRLTGVACLMAADLIAGEL